MAGMQGEDLLLITESPSDTEKSGKDLMKKSSTRIKNKIARRKKVPIQRMKAVTRRKKTLTVKIALSKMVFMI